MFDCCFHVSTEINAIQFNMDVDNLAAQCFNYFHPIKISGKAFTSSECLYLLLKAFGSAVLVRIEDYNIYHSNRRSYRLFG